MSLRRAWIIGIALLLLATASLSAASLNVGYVSFDNLIPSGLTPGVNAFSLANLSGDPGSGGFALPPDFPIFTPLVFKTSSLSLIMDGSAQDVPLGDLPAGFLDPPFELQFPETALITSAIFTATLDGTTALLFDGTPVTLPGQTITAALLAQAGEGLVPGASLALVAVTTQEAPAVPEPGSFFLLVGPLGSLAAVLSIRHFPRR